MRPEVIAFRELETLVRKLSDQLAGYRRRALSAESKAKELELAADELRASTARLTDDAREAKDRANSLATSLRASEEREAMARDALARETLARESAVRDGAARDSAIGAADGSIDIYPVSGREPARNEKALARENAELKTRLSEASERTRQLAERIRFLRQQVTQVAEK